jgi:hypoxanthine phosphoribosyltransferase
VDIKSKTYLTWSDIEMLVHDLCAQIVMPGIQIEHIYGLPRGGLIPAVMVSHKLGIPMVKTIKSSNTLIVDDICDSGKTFVKWSKKHPTAEYACLHYKPHTSNFIPTFSSNRLQSDNWIVYPWERDDSDTIQDYLK